mgnify:CR=1 FL=1
MNYPFFGINHCLFLFKIIDKIYRQVRKFYFQDYFEFSCLFFFFVFFFFFFFCVCVFLKLSITTEQKKALLELLHHQFHHTIGHEIRKLLVEYKCRDEEDEQYAIMDEID